MFRFCFLCFIISTALGTHVCVAQNLASVQTDVGLTVSVRALRFAVAGNELGTNPNILSELVWGDVGAVGVDFGGIVEFGRLSIRSRVGFGRVLKGHATDTDYRYDNRMGMVYRVRVSAHAGHLWSLCVRPGYSVVLGNSTLSGGLYFDMEGQQLRLLNSRSKAVGFDVIEGLDSYYYTNWISVGPSLNYDVPIFSNLHATASLHYGTLWLKGKGNWNLREDFQQPISYRHRANGGYDMNFHGRLAYRLPHGKQLFWAYTDTRKRVANGTDELYLVEGADKKSRLNEVVANANEISLGLTILW